MKKIVIDTKAVLEFEKTHGLEFIVDSATTYPSATLELVGSDYITFIREKEFRSAISGNGSSQMNALVEAIKFCSEKTIEVVRLKKGDSGVKEDVVKTITCPRFTELVELSVVEFSELMQ